MNLINCPNCQNQIKPNNNICPYCGSPLKQNTINNNQININKKNNIYNILKNIVYIIIGFALGIFTITLKDIKQLNSNNEENNIITENENKKEETDNIIEETQDENIIEDTTKEDIESNDEEPNLNNNVNNNSSLNNNNNTSNNSNNSNTNDDINNDCPDCLKYVKIGNYVGMNIFDALKECDEKGIDTKVQMSYSEGAEEYTVIEQNGEPGGTYIKDVGLVIKLTVQSKYKMGNIELEIVEGKTKNIDYISASSTSPEIILMDKKSKTIKYSYFINYKIQLKNENTESTENTYILELYDSNNNIIFEDIIYTDGIKTIKDKIDITDKIKNNENYILKIK